MLIYPRGPRKNDGLRGGLVRRFSFARLTDGTQMKRKLQRVKIGDLKPNPTFRHETLLAPLIERIKNFMAILTEVFDTPLQEVIDNFRRDANPEREVEVRSRIR